jgi:hypothetical protein
MPEHFYDFTLDAADLTERFPLQWAHPHKQAIHQRVEPPGSIDRQRLRVRRWKTARPERVRPLPREAVIAADGPFAYDDGPGAGKVWYPNFADYHLFGFWNSPLLAQDELQVLEHPVLARVREWLLSEGHLPRTVDGDGQSTPVTIEGALRRCALDLSSTDRLPLGLYGQRFARAPLADVLAATRKLDPPTVTNLVAMAAPSGGKGRYSSLQLEWILAAAYTAFSAVRACSEGERAILHTGFWGCGAFGGDRTLTALLQLLAAGAAGIDQVVFHSFSGHDRQDLARAQEHLETLSARLDDDPSAWIVAVHGLGFEWGVSDGN